MLLLCGFHTLVAFDGIHITWLADWIKDHRKNMILLCIIYTTCKHYTNIKIHEYYAVLSSVNFVWLYIYHANLQFIIMHNKLFSMMIFITNEKNQQKVKHTHTIMNHQRIYLTFKCTCTLFTISSFHTDGHCLWP